MMTHAYHESYLDEVVENQGKLFDLFVTEYPDKDTKDFIVSYMKSSTRKYIDEAQPYVNNMSAKDLLIYFMSKENYKPTDGSAIQGFVPDWIGEFYAYYQWYYNIPSSVLTDKVTVDYLIKSYPGLHDLDLKLAVEKVGEVDWR